MSAAGRGATIDSDAEAVARRRFFESTPRKRFLRFWGEFFRRRPLGAFGLVLMLVMILAAVLADRIAPYDPTALSFKDLLAPPSPAHLFGTDNFGRDVFSRLLYGARTALLVGFSASLVGCTLGLVLGIVGAYVGGKTDQLIQRLMDVLLSFPLIVIAIAVVAALGTGEDKIGNVIAAITVPIIPRVSRVVRSSALAVRSSASACSSRRRRGASCSAARACSSSSARRGSRSRRASRSAWPSSASTCSATRCATLSTRGFGRRDGDADGTLAVVARDVRGPRRTTR